MRDFSKELGFDKETKTLVALVSLGPQKEIKEVCLNCMPDAANFNIGFGHRGICENCHKEQMIYEIM